MKLFGIIGKPLDHILSPRLYARAFRKLGVNARYLPFQVERRHLKNLILCMKLVDVRGLNVTAPHKETVLPFLDGLDISARLSGAVNTIVRRKNRFVGFNTDGEGFFRGLGNKRTSIRGKRILFLGSGGAARGIAARLAREYPARVVFLNRSAARGKRLVRFFKTKFPKTKWSAFGFTAARCRALLPETDLLIQTTPVSLPLPWKKLLPQTVVADIVTHPAKSPFLQKAKTRGCRTVDGLRMLRLQAEENLKLWF